MIDLISRDPAILMVCLTAAAGKWIWRTRVAKRGYDLPAMLALFRVALGGFILKPLSASVLAPKFAMLAQRAPISLTMNDWRVWVMVFFCDRVRLQLVPPLEPRHQLALGDACRPPQPERNGTASRPSARLDRAAVRRLAGLNPAYPDRICASDGYRLARSQSAFPIMAAHGGRD